MIWLPLFAAVLGAATVVQRRVFLRATRMPADEFLVLLFPVLFVTGLFAALVLGERPFDSLVWSPVLGVLMTSYIVIAAIAQWAFYRGMRSEAVGSTGVLGLVVPLVSVGLAALVFPAERDVRLWFAGGIAAIALAVSHLRGLRLSSREGERLVLLACVIFGVEAVFERSLLANMSGLDLYLVRTAALSVVFSAVFGLPKIAVFGVQLRGMISIALVYTLFLLTVFQSYVQVGVTLTSVVGLLSAVILYNWSIVVDREPIRGRVALAGMVVLASVVYAMLLAGS